jgi:hypothetical protein
MKPFPLVLLFFLVTLTPVFSNADLLHLTKEDLIITETGEGGYHLWIRKKGTIASVLLTESTTDPKKRLDIYALRSSTTNTVNDGEKRVLDGVFLEKNQGIVDSTTEPHETLGEAFHLYIPYVVRYGYPWSRNGEIYITVGTFVNVKTFSKPYADWSGDTSDNAFVIQLAPGKEQRIAQPDYIEDAVDAFEVIAREGGGRALTAAGRDDLVPKIEEILSGVKGNRLDLVLALDTTLSMEDELPYLRAELAPLIERHVGRFKSARIGLLLYRDYFEEYLVKPLPFSPSIDLLQTRIDRIRVRGGRELPEAVHEALYSGLETYPWEAESRQLILIGDAPPHLRPRGGVTEEMVYTLASQKNVALHTIILPQ